MIVRYLSILLLFFSLSLFAFSWETGSSVVSTTSATSNFPLPDLVVGSLPIEIFFDGKLEFVRGNSSNCSVCEGSSSSYGNFYVSFSNFPNLRHLDSGNYSALGSNRLEFDTYDDEFSAQRSYRIFSTTSKNSLSYSLHRPSYSSCNHSVKFTLTISSVKTCPDTSFCTPSECSLCDVTYCTSHTSHYSTTFSHDDIANTVSSSHSFCSNVESLLDDWQSDVLADCSVCGKSYCRLCPHRCGDSLCPYTPSCDIRNCSVCGKLYCSVHTIHYCNTNGQDVSTTTQGNVHVVTKTDGNAVVNVEVTTTGGDLSSITTKLDSLLSQSQSNSTAIEDFSARLDSSTSTINSTISSSADALRSDISSATQSINTYISNMATSINSSVDNLSSDINTLSNQVSDQSQDIQSLQTSIQDGNTTLTNIDSGIDEVVDYVRIIRTTSENQDTRLSSIVDELIVLKGDSNLNRVDIEMIRSNLISFLNAYLANSENQLLSISELRDTMISNYDIIKNSLGSYIGTDLASLKTTSDKLLYDFGEYVTYTKDNSVKHDDIVDVVEAIDDLSSLQSSSDDATRVLLQRIIDKIPDSNGDSVQPEDNVVFDKLSQIHDAITDVGIGGSGDFVESSVSSVSYTSESTLVGDEIRTVEQTVSPLNQLRYKLFPSSFSISNPRSSITFDIPFFDQSIPVTIDFVDSRMNLLVSFVRAFSSFCMCVVFAFGIFRMFRQY